MVLWVFYNAVKKNGSRKGVSPKNAEYPFSETESGYNTVLLKIYTK